MLGIDVSKETLTCTLLDPATQRRRWQRSFANSPAGVEQLLVQTPATAAWVLEPTGRYRLTVAKQAPAAGRVVLMAVPKKAKAYLASLQDRAKTDRLDSLGLAHFAMSRPPTKPLPPYPVKSDTVERLNQLLSARRGIVEASAALEQRLGELPHAAGPLAEAVAQLKAQRKELDRQIAALCRDAAAFPAVARLREVPGIGPVTAATLASRLTSHHFGRADAFVAYVGLDVAVIQSGKRKGERGLSRKGDDELRRLLYLCAQSTAFRPDSPLHALYQRELAKGRPRTAALCVVARKLARLCWSIVEHGTTYDPERIYHQHSSAAAPPTDPST